MTLDDWLKTRPECVQKLAAEFPLGLPLQLDNAMYFVIGYTEDDSLVISSTHPGHDYDTAYETRQRVCAQHVRDGIAQVLDTALGAMPNLGE